MLRYKVIPPATTKPATTEAGCSGDPESAHIQKTTLVGALDLRNNCGHPTKYRPGVKKVSAYIEDIVTIVFP